MKPETAPELLRLAVTSLTLEELREWLSKPSSFETFSETFMTLLTKSPTSRRKTPGRPSHARYIYKRVRTSGLPLCEGLKAAGPALLKFPRHRKHPSNGTDKQPHG